MGQYDKLLQAALKSGSHDDLRKLEEPFARQIGQDPAVMAARKAETRAKYGRPLTTSDDDLRKAHRPDDGKRLDEAAVLKSIQAIEQLAAIRKKIRTGRKKRT